MERKGRIPTNNLGIIKDTGTAIIDSSIIEANANKLKTNRRINKIKQSLNNTIDTINSFSFSNDTSASTRDYELQQSFSEVCEAKDNVDSMMNTIQTARLNLYETLLSAVSAKLSITKMNNTIKSISNFASAISILDLSNLNSKFNKYLNELSSSIELKDKENEKRFSNLIKDEIYPEVKSLLGFDDRELKQSGNGEYYFDGKVAAKSGSSTNVGFKLSFDTNSTYCNGLEAYTKIKKAIFMFSGTSVLTADKQSTIIEAGETLTFDEKDNIEALTENSVLKTPYTLKINFIKNGITYILELILTNSTRAVMKILDPSDTSKKSLIGDETNGLVLETSVLRNASEIDPEYRVVLELAIITEISNTSNTSVITQFEKGIRNISTFYAAQSEFIKMANETLANKVESVYNYAQGYLAAESYRQSIDSFFYQDYISDLWTIYGELVSFLTEKETINIYDTDFIDSIKNYISKISTEIASLLEDSLNGISTYQYYIEMFSLFFASSSAFGENLTNILSKYNDTYFSSSITFDLKYPYSIKSFFNWNNSVNKYISDSIFNLALLYIGQELGINGNSESNSNDNDVFNDMVNMAILNGINCGAYDADIFNSEFIKVLNYKSDLKENYNIEITEYANREKIATQLSLQFPSLNRFNSYDLTNFLNGYNDLSDNDEEYSKIKRPTEMLILKEIFLMGNEPRTVVDNMLQIFKDCDLNFRTLLLRRIFIKLLSSIKTASVDLNEKFLDLDDYSDDEEELTKYIAYWSYIYTSGSYIEYINKENTDGKALYEKLTESSKNSVDIEKNLKKVFVDKRNNNKSDNHYYFTEADNESLIWR